MTRRWWTRLVLGLVALGLVALALPWLLADDRLELTVTYDEVGDLVTQAQVRFGDVAVGTVDEVALRDDHRAEVTLRLDRDVRLPERAVAHLRMSAVLGERYVDLVPDPERGGEVVPGGELPGDFEQDIELLVQAGGDLLGAVTADHLARVIRVGHRTVDGRGDQLGALLDDLGDYVGQLDASSDELAHFIDASERLTSTLAPDARLHAGALEDLADLSEVLAEEEEQLVVALEQLAGTAEVGARIVSDNRESLDDLLARVSRLSGEVLRVDGALENLLLWLPRHNLHIPGGVVSEHAQVLNDFTICGVTDEPDNPANACRPSNPNQPNDPAPGYVASECVLYNVDCEGFPDGVTPYRGELEEQRTTAEERRRKVEAAEGTADHDPQPRRPRPRGLP